MYKMRPGVVVFEEMMRSLKGAAGQQVVIEYVEKGSKKAVTTPLEGFVAFLCVSVQNKSLPFIDAHCAIQTISTVSGDVLYHNPLIEGNFGNPRSVVDQKELLKIAERLEEQCFGREYAKRAKELAAEHDSLYREGEHNAAAKLRREWNESIGC